MPNLTQLFNSKVCKTVTAIITKTSDSGKKEIIGQPWDVYIGSTHVSNPEDFLKQVQLLTGKYQFFVFS